ncbi:MAG: N-acetylmuramoyl-L-alanine amidase [Verrucomicrobia bacterium]|nr:N-acetylmuramoyl-L-alanine amidase [Verrucomicrobiota bacterium]
MFRLLTIFLLLAASALAAHAQSPLSKLPHVELYGHTYVPLADWAVANGLKAAWTQKDKVAIVTNRTLRLQFEADSRKASIDRIGIYLSVPFAVRAGTPYISVQDLTTTIQPVLFPVKNSPGQRVRTICLDPGHGGKDTGNIAGSAQEKRYTLQLALEVKTLLKEAGLKVVLTRNDDRFIELGDRDTIARKNGADLFVSLHFNGQAGGNDGRGAESYCLTPAKASSTNARGEGAENGNFPGNKFNEKNVLLAYQIHKRLERDLGLEDRGVRRARFAVLRTAEMPAVLIEGGFLSNPDERRRITDAGQLRQMARAIVDGLLAYKRLVERAEIRAAQ